MHKMYRTHKLNHDYNNYCPTNRYHIRIIIIYKKKKEERKRDNSPMKVNQNIRSVAVNFLKGEFRVPRPQIESPAQLEANAARVETTRLLGSQAVTRRKGKKERRIVTRIRRKIDRRRTTLLSALFIGPPREMPSIR